MFSNVNASGATSGTNLAGKHHERDTNAELIEAAAQELKDAERNLDQLVRDGDAMLQRTNAETTKLIKEGKFEEAKAEAQRFAKKLQDARTRLIAAKENFKKLADVDLHG